jgi:hypothetical protein
MRSEALLGILWLIVLASTNLRIREADHFPTGVIAIAAVARVAVVALHGVVQEQIEKGGGRNAMPTSERGVIELHCTHEVDLLLVGEKRERMAELRLAGTIEKSQAVAVGVLPAAKWAGELNIDVVDDPGPIGAGLVGVDWDELVAKSGKGACFRGGEKAPGAVQEGIIAGNPRGSCCRRGQLEELAPREIFVPAHECTPNKEIAVAKSNGSTGCGGSGGEGERANSL